MHPEGLASALAAALLLAGCVTRPPAPGSAEAEVQRRWSPPTSRHALPRGGLRLGYASGPFGRET